MKTEPESRIYQQVPISSGLEDKKKEKRTQFKTLDLSYPQH